MGYLLHVLLAMGTLAFAELGWVGEGEHAWAVPLLLLVPYALAASSRRAFLHGGFRLGNALERLLAFTPVALQAVAILRLGWLERLRSWGFAVGTLDDWGGLDLIPALLPYLTCQIAAIDARARCLVFHGDSSGNVRAFQLRLLLSALLPLLLFLACSTVITRSPERQVVLEEVGLLGAAAVVAIFALFLYGMPFFLRHAWHTAPIERGWARTMLEQVAESAGFRFRELLLWNTGQQMSNAAIVGFTERSRYVFFSDLLLQQLGPRELAAVFAHEMGHARRGHAAVFGAFALGFFLATSLLVERLEVENELWSGALLLAALGAWYLAFGFLSRRFELEADLESLRVVGESGSLVRALELVTGAHAHERSSWRHFSTRERVAFLRRAEVDPLVGMKLKLSLARWRTFGYALFLVSASIHLVALVRSWNADWLVADLRLGRYEEAAQRAGGSRIDPEMAALARFAAGTSAEARDPVALELAARQAIQRGDLGGAVSGLELACLLGRKDLVPVVDYLKAEGREPGGLDAVPLPWRKLLRASVGAGTGKPSSP